MRIGKLHHKITIEKPSVTVAEFGHRVTDWTCVECLFADVRPMGSSERVSAFKMQSGATHVVTVRYQQSLSVVNGECRIVFGDRIFNIVGKPRNFDERGRWLIMDVTEGGTDGH